MTTPATAQQEDNHTLIVRAARELFTSRGLHETTMADIAGAAGVSRATVFNHFGSKTLVLDAIAAEVLEIYLSLIDRVLAEERSGDERLLELTTAMGRGIAANRAFYRVIFVEMARASLGYDEKGASQQVRRDLNEKLLQLFLRGQVEGDFTRTFRAEDMVAAFESLVFGTVTQWLQRENAEPLEEVMKRACRILLNGISK